MKKEYKLILFIISFTIGCILFEVPLEHWLDRNYTGPAESELLSEVLMRSFILFVLLSVIKKLGLGPFNGIGSKVKIREKGVLTAPAFLIGLGVWGNWTTFTNAEVHLFLLFALSVMLVGLVEEACMRGLVLPLLLNRQSKKRYSLYSAVLISALIFGLLHYIGLIRNPDNFWGITPQVGFGIAIGIVLGALMLRTGNIFIVGVCHGFINFILGNRILRDKAFEQATGASSMDVISIIGTTVIFLVIALIGLVMIRSVDKAEVELELRSLRI